MTSAFDASAAASINEATEPGRLQAVREEARRFLRNEWSTNAFRELIDDPLGYAPALWQRVRALGWPGVALPEALGGAGGGFAELAALAQELGRALAPLPLLPSLTAAQALLLSENEELKAEVLPRVATGEALLSLALLEEELTAEPTRVRLAARRDAGGYRLSGVKLFVPLANAAHFFVVVARPAEQDEAPALLLVPREAEGLSTRQLKPLDWSPLGELTFADVFVPDTRVLAAETNGAAVLEETLLRGGLLTCLELLGVAETALQLAVDYAKDRVAFGRPIGSFQAVKGRLVNLRMNTEIATALCQAAVHDVAAEAPERRLTAARAAFWAVDTLRKVPEGSLQVFGGIGFTWEHDIHLYLRRATTLAALLGEPARYREIVVEALDRG
jgi:alkylation response protein AidB-like acyl-CoA dehydrogenase